MDELRCVCCTVDIDEILESPCNERVSLPGVSVTGPSVVTFRSFLDLSEGDT